MTEPADAKSLVASAALLQADLPEDRAARLLRYLDAMLLLNEQINLTAVRDREQAVVRHVLDGLAFARTGLRPRHVLDLGSGNGFPGVCIAALHPGASVVLLDKTGKKVRAMGSCLVAAGMPGVETLHVDAAQAPALQKDLRHAFDLVTARAVGRPELVAELASPFVRPGGHLVLWLDEGAEVAERLDRFRLAKKVEYDLPAPAASHRRLACWQRLP